MNCSTCRRDNCDICRTIAIPFSDWLTVYPITFTYGYDSDRYDLVEKKDWKLNQLKLELEDKKNKINSHNHIVIELQEDIDSLEREIKDLEQ